MEITTIQELRELKELMGLQKPPLETASRPERSTNGHQPVLRMTQSAYQRTVNELSKRKPEWGGLILGPVGDRLITHFWFDQGGISSPAKFTWDFEKCSQALRKAIDYGLEGKGFVHSHPSGGYQLSRGDLEFVEAVFAIPANDVGEVWMPIVVDGAMYPFVIFRDDPNKPQPAHLWLT